MLADDFLVTDFARWSLKMIRFRSFLAGVLAMLGLAVAGCGGGKYQPVTGEIVFPDGRAVTALDGGRVTFIQQSAGTEAPISASGTIDAQGKFTLGTETVDDGTVPGSYQIVISPPEPSGDIPIPPVILPKYSQAHTSGLTQEVKQGVPNHFKLEVQPVK